MPFRLVQMIQKQKVWNGVGTNTVYRKHKQGQHVSHTVSGFPTSGDLWQEQGVTYNVGAWLERCKLCEHLK